MVTECDNSCNKRLLRSASPVFPYDVLITKHPLGLEKVPPVFFVEANTVPFHTSNAAVYLWSGYFLRIWFRNRMALRLSAAIVLVSTAVICLTLFAHRQLFFLLLGVVGGVAGLSVFFLSAMYIYLLTYNPKIIKRSIIISRPC